MLSRGQEILGANFFPSQMLILVGHPPATLQHSKWKCPRQHFEALPKMATLNRNPKEGGAAVAHQNDSEINENSKAPVFIPQLKQKNSALALSNFARSGHRMAKEQKTRVRIQPKYKV
jgi:hypothetical protein